MPERVTAVVPHYNSPGTLRPLLTHLVDGGFDGVHVVDDASNACDMAAFAREFPDVRFVLGQQNLGPGGNRNRALNSVNGGIAWFVDADMRVVSSNIPNTLRKAFAQHPQRLIGGLILSKSGEQMAWNYGHEMDPVADVAFGAFCQRYRNSQGRVRSAAWGKLAADGMDYAWIDPVNNSPKPRAVDWVAEGNFAVPINALRAVGGYDEYMRYHEGQDLARRLREHGVDSYFDPAIVTQHLEVEVRARRAEDFREGQFYFYNKHRGMTRAEFNQLYPPN